MAQNIKGLIFRILCFQVLILCACFLPYSGNLWSADYSVTEAELESEISKKILSVSQFQYIKEIADRLKVKVWIFGGSAAAFGHYVRWDLQRRNGDLSYQDIRFDYNYLNIYRPTQDCDLVVDGTVEQAVELERLIRDQYPHLQGNKIKWEVRLLREKRDDKEPLLKNSNFLRQHTDSNSIGLIELTGTSNRIRDLRSWDLGNSIFLRDLAKGEITYLFSDKHESTARYREGLNPSIFSVIRFLIKVLQFDLNISNKDRSVIQKIIDQFNPKRDLENSYASNWLENNGKKLFQQSSDLERASEILDSFNLRRRLKLIGDVHVEDSLAWWMNREALRTKPITSGSGRTAAMMGISVVSHETKDFFAFESIKRSPRGLPNVFVSRNGAAGETALYGEAFYTRIGREGARGTGFTIRFTVNPLAKEGTDFEVVGDYVLVHNRAVLTVIPESMNLGPYDYLELCLSLNWKFSDYGLIEKLKYLVKSTKKDDLKKDFHPIIQRLRKIRSSVHRVSGTSIDFEALNGFDFYFLQLFDILGTNSDFFSTLGWSFKDFFDLAADFDRLRDLNTNQKVVDFEFRESFIKTIFESPGFLESLKNSDAFVRNMMEVSKIFSPRVWWDSTMVLFLEKFLDLSLKLNARSLFPNEWISFIDSVSKSMRHFFKKSFFEGEGGILFIGRIDLWRESLLPFIIDYSDRLPELKALFRYIKDQLLEGALIADEAFLFAYLAVLERLEDLHQFRGWLFSPSVKIVVSDNIGFLNSVVSGLTKSLETVKERYKRNDRYIEKYRSSMMSFLLDISVEYFPIVTHADSRLRDYLFDGSNRKKEMTFLLLKNVIKRSKFSLKKSLWIKDWVEYLSKNWIRRNLPSWFVRSLSGYLSPGFYHVHYNFDSVFGHDYHSETMPRAKERSLMDVHRKAFSRLQSCARYLKFKP